jgi:Mycothiol maleylpyruvate isomerase N-terminal domain
MRPLTFAHDDAVDGLLDEADHFLAAAASCDDLQLLGPSRCHGWSLLDVVVHVRMGLQEMAVGTTNRRDVAPDCDAASYWAAHPDDRDSDPVPHILWLRRVSSAYARPRGAVDHLQDAVAGAVGAVRSMPDCVVEFQGKRMRSGDFLATWVVELAVHRLDLALEQDSSSGLAWARRTLEAVASADLPDDLDDRSAVLVGLGRIAPPPSRRLAGFPVSL